MRTAPRLRLLAAVVATALLAACSAPQGASAPASSSGSAAGAPAGADAYPQPLPLSGDFVPVHDPAMVKAPDGTYLLYSTGQNLQIRSSKDRQNFTLEGPVWPKGAPWTFSFTSATDRRALWAPDISFHDGTFYLYYSASSFGSRNSAIFLATSPTGLPGTWKNVGLVWRTSERDDYNAIDPNLHVDDTGWWLSFGSFWSGLKMVKVNPATGLPIKGETRLYSLATRPRSVDGAVEAPYIVRHDDYYYLFASFDACCRGTSSTYRTMVGRSKTITGPYVDRDGTPMTEGGGTEVLSSHGDIVGPGHPAVLQDGADWLLIYHYYADDAAPATGTLAINKLEWVDGWPVAR